MLNVKGKSELSKLAPKHKNAKEIWREEDGWWAILNDNLEIDGCCGIREDSLRKLKKRLSEAKLKHK